MGRMDTTDFLSTKTAADLDHIRSLDLARVIGLQAKFADRPNPLWYALRNHATEFPRSLHLDLIAKAAMAVGTSTDATLGTTTRGGPTVGGRIHSAGARVVPHRATRPAARAAVERVHARGNHLRGV